MPKTRTQLATWVLARIDEISAVQSLAISQTDVEAELDESATQVLLKARREAVYPAASSIAESATLVRLDSDGNPLSVLVPFSDDVLRFLRVKANHWKQYVDTLIDVESAEYRRQLNPYERGSINEPAAALIPFLFTYSYGSNPVTTVSYKQAVEIFPAPNVLTNYTTTSDLSAAQEALKTAAAAKNLTPVFYPATSGKTLVLSDLIVVKKMAAEAMPDTLYDSLVWHCAASCLINLRQANLAATAIQKFYETLNVKGPK